MSPSHTIVWKDKLSLSIHEAVLHTPEDRALIDLLIAEFGLGEEIHDPLEVNAEGEILDGRHRWKAALECDLITQVPTILTDRDPESVVCDKLTQRRHYSKSAKAYALRHMAAKAAKEGRESRTDAANAAKSDVSRLNRFTSKAITSLAALAAKSGLSTDILQQAMKLERDYMQRADKLVIDWLELHPEETESWLHWTDTHPYQAMPWTCWRAACLAAEGIKDDAKAVHVIVPNYREIEEDKIFNGLPDPDGEEGDRKSYSLGASLKALGSIFATAGKPRTDLDPNVFDIVTTLQLKVKTFTRTMWAQWGSCGPEQRQAVCKDLADAVRQWPDDARALLIANLKAEAAKV